MSDSTQLPALYTPTGTEIGDPLWDPSMFMHMMEVAKTFSASQLVPEHLRGKPHDCFLALAMAKRSGQEPLSVLQSIHFVKGKAGWAATYLIARAKIAGMPIRWDVVDLKPALKEKGKPIRNVSVTARAEVDGQVVTATITTSDAIAEGWTSNPKYFTMTEQMLHYRTATRLVRLYMPEVMLGLPAVEEVEVLNVEAARPSQAVADAEALLIEVDDIGPVEVPIREAEPVEVAPVEEPKPAKRKLKPAKRKAAPAADEAGQVSLDGMPS